MWPPPRPEPESKGNFSRMSSASSHSLPLPPAGPCFASLVVDLPATLPWGVGKGQQWGVATHSEDKLMGSDLILPLFLFLSPTTVPQPQALCGHDSRCCLDLIIFLHTAQTPHVQPRTSQQQARDLFCDTF